MNDTVERLGERLHELERRAGSPGQYVVAFSGGLDSTVLLHALASLHSSGHICAPIMAIHVDHGLHEDAQAWAAHCETIAAELSVEFQCIAVEVGNDSGRGPEAAAREARYAALRSVISEASWLLTAHHREDQAETLLLNLLRGSGPAGIAGIEVMRRYSPGWLARPLLDVGRAALRHYAEICGLRWIEDSSNAELTFDRNFLRHEVFPRLNERWDDSALRLCRSAAHARETLQLLDDLAGSDLLLLGGRPERLAVSALCRLSNARQRNVIRFALRQLGLPLPSAKQLQAVTDELLPARDDSQPVVSWSGASIRRYRDGLYCLAAQSDGDSVARTVTSTSIDLGPGLGQLKFQEAGREGLDPALMTAGLSLRLRKGGEKIRLQGHRHTKKLKKLLQEEGIVPWMRDRLPLVYAGERLVAVADLWLADDALANPGLRLHWEGRPALH